MHQDALTLRTTAANIAAAVGHPTGHPPLESDADSVALLLAALTDGNYREAACAAAGISKHSLYRALKRAEAGNEAAIALRDAVERAEAAAEAGIVKKWRQAIDAGPQYWAAAATFLERKSPDRWGKRQDDTSVPRVVVQIGARDSDVTVTVGSLPDTTPTPIDVTPVAATGYVDAEAATSDKTSYVNQTATGEPGASRPPGLRRGNRVGLRPGRRRATRPTGADRVKGDR